MEPFFNPLLNSAVSVASAHDVPRWNVTDESLVVVTGRLAVSILLPVLSRGSRKLGKHTITRVVAVMNRSTEPATVTVDGGGTIEGSRAVTIDAGKNAVFVAIPDPASAGASTLEYGLIAV